MIGLGWFTSGRALPALKESDRCVPLVLVSGSAEKAQRLADETDGATRGLTYDQFHDGLASDAYDAVYIVIPNALHLEYVETASAFLEGLKSTETAAGFDEVDFPGERSVERYRSPETVEIDGLWEGV